MDNSNKKRILYINYIDLSSSATSGSGVRPYRIYAEMKRAGHEVILLSGSQAASDRPSLVKSAYEEIKKNKPDLCYIESPTYPILRHTDRRLIKRLHKMGIPTAYFYRDFYKKFPEQFPKRTSLTGRIKDFGLDLLQRLTDRVLRYCDIVYLPSEEAKKLFDYADMRTLPPAGENRIPESHTYSPTAIYVGGVSGHYDVTTLLEAFEELHSQNAEARLILVSRKDEWEALDVPQKNASWLEVRHLSGEALGELYSRASVALVVPNTKFEYNSFAVSVKVFEYMSYGLPVVTIDSAAMTRIVNTEKIGIVTSQGAEALKEGLERLFGDAELYAEYRQNVREALLTRNLWQHRVEKIVSELLEKKAEGNG